MDASGWDGYGPVGGRLCVKNLSFGIAPKALAEELRKIGFSYVTDEDVNVVRKGQAATTKFCIAFVPMESWDDVDTAVEKLKGRLVPSCSYKALHAERAIPRMKNMVNKGSSKTVEPERDEPSTDLAAGSSGQKQVKRLLEVKKEEKNKQMAKSDVHSDFYEKPWTRRRVARGEM